MDVEVHATVEILVSKQGFLLGGLGYLLATATSLVVGAQEYLPEGQHQDLERWKDGIDDHHGDYLLTNVAVPLLVEVIIDADEHVGY